MPPRSFSETSREFSLIQTVGVGRRDLALQSFSPLELGPKGPEERVLASPEESDGLGASARRDKVAASQRHVDLAVECEDHFGILEFVGFGEDDDLYVVCTRDDDGLLAEAVGIDRRENRGGKHRMHDRPACGEGVGGGPGGGGDDEAVGVERREFLALHEGLEIHEACDGALRDDGFIEGVPGEEGLALSLRGNLEDAAMLHHPQTREECWQDVLRFLKLGLGEEPYCAAIDAENGDGEISELAHRAEDGAVTADDKKQIDVSLGGVGGQIAGTRNVPRALGVEADCGTESPQDLQDTVHGIPLPLEARFHSETDAWELQHGNMV
jgi:hypothetical protein